MTNDQHIKLLELARRAVTAMERIVRAVESNPETLKSQVDTELERLKNTLNKETQEKYRAIEAGYELLKELHELDPEKYGAPPKTES